MGDDSAVPHLIDVLKDDDAVVRELAEYSLWAIWNRSGDPKIDALLQEGIHLIQSDRLDEAITKLDEVVKGAPGFPEGYNRRSDSLLPGGSVREIDRRLRRGDQAKSDALRSTQWPGV
jgi:hypothetical protein